MNAAVMRFIAAGKIYRTGPPWARRGAVALHPTDIAIAPGEMVAMVGESGSGKTTFGRLCLGLATPSSGQVLFQDAPFPTDRRLLRGQLAAVLQNPSTSLNPHLRVGTSVAEPLRVARLADRRAAAARVAAMLERVGLPPVFAERLPHELSGGQRQRVAIARALVTAPRLIVFDEAVSALDVSMQAQILNLVRDVQRATGFSGLFITHDLAAARYVADRVVVLRSGHIVNIASAADLYAQAAEPYTRQLQGASGLT